MESDAVRLILQRVREGGLILVSSPAHFQEINAITDTMERMELQAILTGLSRPLMFENPAALRDRADFLVRRGVGVADAAHLAFAEAGSSYFVTCDDRLLRKCRLLRSLVWCGTPLEFCVKEGLR